jgi:sugar O-acyltransferase (sialic acid O-acetyltransferase NeuD family)
MREVIIWGASGQAIVLHECLFGSDYKIVALFDNGPTSLSPFPAIPLLGGEKAFADWIKHRNPSLSFLVAVGGQDRLKVHDWLISEGLLPATVIHPTAYVAADATIEPGCQILAHATICARAHLDRSVIVNTAASVDHECVVGAGAHVAPGARLAGRVTVGQRVFIGMGSAILPRLTIGDDTVIGAGAVVVDHVPPGVVMVGVPARIQRRVSALSPLPSHV